MEDDIERLKDLRDTLKEAGEAKGHAHMQPKYCKEMAKVLERHIEEQETLEWGEIKQIALESVLSRRSTVFEPKNFHAVLKRRIDALLAAEKPNDHLGQDDFF